MAQIRRQPYTKPFPPGTKIIKRGTRKGKPVARVVWPDGRREVVRTNQSGDRLLRFSKTWTIRYYKPNGERCVVKGYRDRKATEALAAELEKRAQRVDGGFADTLDEHAKRPLLEHLADYVRYLTAKGNTPAHVTLTETRVKAVLTGCQFVKIGDVQPSFVISFLGHLRTPSKAPDGGVSRGRSITTANYYLTAVRGFTRWLWRDRRAPVDPLAGMAKLAHAESDVRHARRDLSGDELDWLLGTVRASERVFRGLTGADRLHLYLTAAASGFRVSELGSLAPEAFDLDGEPPVVRVQAGYAKNRKEAEQPLPADVADALRTYLAGKPARAPVWPGTWTEKAATMIRKDLADARGKWLASFPDARQRDDAARSDFLAYCDAAGRYADFHGSTRHTYVSRIVSSGASAKVAQHLARHSTVQLTLGRYAHAALHDVTAAVDSLAGMVPTDPASKALAATGTDGKAAAEAQNLTPQLTPQQGKKRDKSGQTRIQASADDDRPAELETTQKTSFPRVFRASEGVKAEGLEPSTYGLKVRCSTD
jgi:integrase